METEYLPPGHPITHDTELDIDSLKQRLDAGELRINDDGKLEVPDEGHRHRRGRHIHRPGPDLGRPRYIAKAPTTPYDLSVGFLNVLNDGAEQLDLDIDELLPQVELVRYSTTVAMNRLIERKGPGSV